MTSIVGLKHAKPRLPIVKSIAGVGTHLYLPLPGKKSVSFDCGVVITDPSGKVCLGSIILLTHAHLDHMSALFTSLLGAQRPGATYHIYVPSSPGGTVKKNFVKLIKAMNELSNYANDISEDNDIETKIKCCRCILIIREVVEDQRIQISNTMFVIPKPSTHTVPSYAYIVYEKSGRNGKTEFDARKDVIFNDHVYKPLYTISGDTNPQTLKDHPELWMSQVVYAECTRVTGKPAEAHKNMHMHISDYADMPNLGNLVVLYHISSRETPEDIDAAIKLHLPWAIPIYPYQKTLE